MEDDTPLTALTAVTAFPEHIINDTVYGQESFRTLQCTIKRVCDGTLSVRLSTPLEISCRLNQLIWVKSE